MIGVSTRLKTLAATGALAGGLGLAALNGAFAASLPAAAAATPTASATQTATTKPAGPGPGARRPDGRFMRGPGFLSPLATYLGINATDLQTALRNGQTLAQVAQAHGKTASDVKTFLTNQLKTNLDKAVAAGKMTSQQETNILNNASSRFDKMINNSFKNQGPRGPFGPGFRRGPGFGPGPMGSYVSTTAKTLGMTNAQVQTELRSGKTLAQIAQEHGKTASDLETAIINSLKPQIEQRLNNKFQGHPWGRPGAPKASPTPATPAPTATP